MNNVLSKQRTPSWCTNGAACDGEHFDQPTYVPASGGTASGVDGLAGALWPAVGAGLNLSDPDGDDDAAVTLHLTGPGRAGQHLDANVYLRPSEAEALAAALLARAATLRAGRV